MKLSFRTCRRWALATVTMAFAWTPAEADDRDLLRQSGAEPYVMILFDNSDSMAWTPPKEGCVDGMCSVWLDGDDPESKFYQAKEAVYEVVQAANGVRFGFAAVNRDHLQVVTKHWSYRAAAVETGALLSLPSGRAYPELGSEEIFGRTYSYCFSSCYKGLDEDPEATITRAI